MPPGDGRCWPARGCFTHQSHIVSRPGILRSGRQPDIVRGKVDVQLPVGHFRFRHREVRRFAPDFGAVFGPLRDERDVGRSVVVPGDVDRVQLLVTDVPFQGGQGVAGDGGASHALQVSGRQDLSFLQALDFRGARRIWKVVSVIV